MDKIINGQRLALVRKRKSKINTYQIVDAKGKPIIKRDPKHKGIIIDHGLRLINENKK